MNTDPVKRFHRRRRMFAVVGGKVLIARPRDSRSHIEWLREEQADFDINRDTRGYYLDGKIVAYRGDYFYGDSTVIETLEGSDYSVLKVLSANLDLGIDVEVWVGAKPGVPGSVFEPINRLYKLGEVLDYASHH